MSARHIPALNLSVHYSSIMRPLTEEEQAAVFSKLANYIVYIIGSLVNNDRLSLTFQILVSTG
jgi:hypothetical protein